MVPKDHGAQKETSTQDLNFRAMSKVSEKDCCLVVCSNILIRQGSPWAHLFML